MAFVSLLLKVRSIEKKKQIFISEKQNSLKIHAGLKPKYTLREKWRHCLYRCRKCLLGSLTGTSCIPKNTWLHREYIKFRHDGTFENFILKSIIGFLSGIFLTFIFFMFLVFQLNFTLSGATLMCSIIGCILTIGLAFSTKVRCVVILALPQFFSSRGRQALLAYTFVLVLTGPAKNTLYNMSILSESLACGQEQLKIAVRQIIEVIKKPFYAIKDAVKKVVGAIKYVVQKIKLFLLSIKRIILAIVQVIKAVFEWLGSVINICNKKLGTPYQRCIRVFDTAISNCNAKMGPYFSFLCSPIYITESVCFIVKPLDIICVLVDFVTDSIVGVVLRKLRNFVRQIRNLLYVKIKFSHSFAFETHSSNSIKNITEGMIGEIRTRTENVVSLFNVISCTASLFVLLIIYNVIIYRYRFLISDRFDNYFITNNMRAIDFQRAKLDKETIFPLNHREKMQYIQIKSMNLVETEKVKLSKSTAVLGLAMMKICSHLAADYSLYWVLATIRYHGTFQSSVRAPKVIGLHIEGKGILADLYRSIVKAFQPLGVTMNLDTVPCLPDPIPPDLSRYVQIGENKIIKEADLFDEVQDFIHTKNPISLVRT